MSAVCEHPVTVAAIARRLGQARQSVQRVVNDLVRDGHAILQPDPHDRRAPRVALTQSGAEALAGVTAANDLTRAETLSRSGLSAVELDAARVTLRSLLDALAAPPAP